MQISTLHLQCLHITAPYTTYRVLQFQLLFSYMNFTTLPLSTMQCNVHTGHNCPYYLKLRQQRWKRYPGCSM